MGTKLSLENLAGIIIGAVILTTIVYIFGFQIERAFASGKSANIVGSMNSLVDTITLNLQSGSSSSVPLVLDKNSILVGFNKFGKVVYKCGLSKRKSIEKPSVCGDYACLCVCDKKKDCKPGTTQNCRLLPQDIEYIVVNGDDKDVNCGVSYSKGSGLNGRYMFLLANPIGPIVSADKFTVKVTMVDNKVYFKLKKV